MILKVEILDRLLDNIADLIRSNTFNKCIEFEGLFDRQFRE